MSRKKRQSIKHDRRADFTAVGIVLLLAVVLRVVYFLQYRAHAPYYSQVIVDSYYYDLWAQRVAAGKGYGPMPYYMAPLYPYALALVYRIVGHSIPVVYVLQLMLGTANTLMVYVLGRRLFGRLSGILAAILVTLYGPLVYLEPKIMTETLAIALSLASILLFMRALDRPSVFGYLIVGIVLGLGAVCRPASLITAALFVLWMILRHRSQPGLARQIVPLLIGIVLAIAPVTARNYFVGRDMVLISSNGGIVFAQGNNERANGVSAPLPGFSGSIGAQRDEEMAIVRKALGRPVKESGSSAYWFGQGLAFIREDPGGFAWLLVRKVIWTIHNREARCSYNFYLERELVPVLRWLVLPFSVLAGLGVFGFIRGPARGMPPGSALLGLYVLSIFLSLVVFSVSSRYRVPMVPALAVFAGFGVIEVANAVRAMNLRALILPAAFLVAILLLSLVPYPIPAVTPEGPANLGVSYFSQGRLDEAIAQLEKAVSLAPDYSYARNKLGEALAKQGRLDEAIEQFSRVIETRPDDALAHRNLGLALKQQGHLDEAVTELREALRLRPGFADAHRRLGSVLAEQGKLPEAAEHYSRAVALDPEEAGARFDLGLLLQRMDRLDEAVRQYREAIRLKPDLADAHNNLAVALYYRGDYAGAWSHLRLARQHGLPPNPGFVHALSERMPEPR